MPETYHLFISHSWTQENHYKRLLGLLDRQNVSFYCHFVAKNDPVHRYGTDLELKCAILEKMKAADRVLILAGLYSKYSKWLNKEIDAATHLGIPIIAIEQWGKSTISLPLKDHATAVVKWQAKSIVKAIKNPE